MLVLVEEAEECQRHEHLKREQGDARYGDEGDVGDEHHPVEDEQVKALFEVNTPYYQYQGSYQCEQHKQ